MCWDFILQPGTFINKVCSLCTNWVKIQYTETEYFTKRSNLIYLHGLFPLSSGKGKNEECTGELIYYSCFTAMDTLETQK